MATQRTTDGALPPAEARQNSAIDRKYAKVRERFGSTPAGRIGLQVVVFLVGLLFVVLGGVLVVLPGPLTIPPLLAGVYVWSLEFGFAKRLRVRMTKSAKEAWANAQQHPARAITITVLGLVAAGVAIWAVGHYELVDKVKDLF